MVKARDPSPQHIGPSHKGRYYSYHSQGRLITAAWPVPRGKPRTPDQARTQIRWKCVCWSIKMLPAETQNWARTAVQNSPFLPRDILVSALYGRGPMVFFPDGSRLINLATKVNMSEVMDNIGYTRGALLYRDVDLWKELPPPESALVLGYNLTTKKPEWVPQAGGGGGAGYVWTNTLYGALSGSALNSKGNVFRMGRPAKFGGALFYGQWTAGVTYRASLYRLDGSFKITQIVARGTLTGTQNGSNAFLEGLTNLDIELDEGVNYAVCVEAPTRPGTYATPIYSQSGSYQIPPWFNGVTDEVRMAKANPAVGDTFDISATGMFGVNIATQLASME